MSFASSLRVLHDPSAAAGPDIDGLVAAALQDPSGVAAAVDEITVSVRDDPDLALLRLFAVVEVLNEVIRDRKAMPELFAEVIKKLREALEWIATALNAASYQLAYHPATGGGVTIGLTFGRDG
jgi:hypothetical protein